MQRWFVYILLVSLLAPSSLSGSYLTSAAASQPAPLAGAQDVENSSSALHAVGRFDQSDEVRRVLAHAMVGAIVSSADSEPVLRMTAPNTSLVRSNNIIAAWWQSVQERVQPAAVIIDEPAGTPPSPQEIDGAGTEAFGTSVSTAGDIDNDGFSDIIVGAPDGNAAYVYFGSATGLGSPLLLTDTATLPAGFGVAVSIAGDVDGDGFSDVMVGANQSEQVLVFLGADLESSIINPLELSNPTPGNSFGSAVATAGDVNGDSLSDMLVGAPDGNSAYVFYGVAGSLDADVDATLTGSGEFGTSVDTAGDVNGDGFADVIVGAPGNTSIFVYLGAAAGLDTATPIQVQRAASGGFGRAVAAAGDVNGDSLSDVIVGAPGEGKAYLYLGPTLGGTPTEFAGDSGQFGQAVSVAGDVNGDGLSDVLVGSTDAVTVFVGAAFTPLLLTGDPGSTFGHAVNTAGDIDGDGFSDVIIGAPGENSGDGQVIIYRGEAGMFGSDPLATTAAYTDADWESDGAGDAGSEFLTDYGYVVNTAGDVNGDGFADVLVSSADETTDQYVVSVYHGSASGLQTTPAVQLESPGTSKVSFGESAASAGDVNGDGYDDIIVGQGTMPNSIDFAYVYCGSAGGILPTPCWSASGEGSFDRFGAAVSSAGDVNGDGFADVIVGAPELGSSLGKAYVYYGSLEGLSTEPDWTVQATGAQSFKRGFLGRSVGTAGDVNGDGYADIIIGVPVVNDPLSPGTGDEGQILIFHGSADGLPEDVVQDTDPPITDKAPSTIIRGDPDADWHIGLSGQAQFGESVGTAGDVNGDGYSDIIAVANFTSINRARAFLYPGGASGVQDTVIISSTIDVREYPDTANVAGIAGDVNGDGLSDVIVGSPFADQAFVYLGSATTMDDTPAATLEGPNSGSVSNSQTFGVAVAGAGDVNGDGYADVIVGDPGSSALGRDSRAYVFYGNNGGVPNTQILRPRQVRVFSDGPIAHLGRADSVEEMRVSMFGRMPLGRSQVRLEWQLEEYSPPASFSTTPGTSAAFTTGTYFITTAPGLELRKSYHWRARLRYPAGNRLGQNLSRWIHMPWDSWTESDFRTAIVAILTSDSPNLVGTPTTLTAILGGGDDPSVSNISYRWDYESDGVVDDTFPTGATQDVRQYLYATGSHTATVGIVYDFGGATTVQTATTRIEVVDDLDLLGVTLINDSPTRINNTTTLTATIVGATALSYIWDFESDGVPDQFTTENVVTHTYPQVQQYTATVTATNTLGVPTADSSTVRITDEPLAGLAASNDSPTPRGITTTLVAEIVAGTNVTYTWDFESDGTTDRVSTPGAASPYTVEYVYPEAGVYEARVTADNSVSQLSVTTPVTITDALIAGLAATNNSPTALGSTTTLSASVSAGENVEYSWDFGDSSSAGSGPVVTHTYQQTGVFEAEVTATNSSSSPGNPPPATTSVVVIAPSSLSISKQSNASVVKTGDLITYTLRVSNNNDQNAALQSLVITDTVPFGTSFVRVLDGGARDGDEVRWTVDTLPEGDSIEVRFVVRASSSGITVVNDQYGVSAAGGFRSTSAAVSVEVEPSDFFINMPIVRRPAPSVPDLVTRISLSPNKTTFSPDEPVTISIVITNQGTGPTVNAFWVDLFINPSQPPTPSLLPTRWDALCPSASNCSGITWLVNKRIQPGESITLFSQATSYDPAQTRWSGSLPTGTTSLYVYADSWSTSGNTGAVPESDETNNRDEVTGLSVPRNR